MTELIHSFLSNLLKYIWDGPAIVTTLGGTF